MNRKVNEEHHKYKPREGQALRLSLRGYKDVIKRVNS